MPDVITIGGSPSAYSKSGLLLEFTRRFVETHGLSTAIIQVRDLPAEDLLLAKTSHSALQESIRLVEQARAVIIATPIYKASYSGLLKVFLDILPQTALLEKIVLPLATGGSASHTMALDYALKPVLAAMGARHFVPGVFMVDSQVQLNPSLDQFQLHSEVEERLILSLEELVYKLSQTAGPAAHAHDKSKSPTAALGRLLEKELPVRV